MELVRERLEHRAPPDATAVDAWGNYVRFLFDPHKVYQFRHLAVNRFLYVAENKSMPNRDDPIDGAAIGRHLVVAWYERVPGTDGDADLIVQPCAGDDGNLTLANLTVAEISKSAGFYPPLTPHDTERDVELIHLAQLLSHGLVVYNATRLSYESGAEWGASWRLKLDDPPEDIEDYTVSVRPLTVSYTHLTLPTIYSV